MAGLSGLIIILAAVAIFHTSNGWLSEAGANAAIINSRGRYMPNPYSSKRGFKTDTLVGARGFGKRALGFGRFAETSDFGQEPSDMNRGNRQVFIPLPILMNDGHQKLRTDWSEEFEPETVNNNGARK